MIFDVQSMLYNKLVYYITLLQVFGSVYELEGKQNIGGDRIVEEHRDSNCIPRILHEVV